MRMPKSDKMIERVKQFLGNEGNASKEVNSYCMRYMLTLSNKEQSVDEYKEWKHVNIKEAPIDTVSSRNGPIMVETYRAKNYKHYS